MDSLEKICKAKCKDYRKNCHYSTIKECSAYRGYEFQCAETIYKFLSKYILPF